MSEDVRLLLNILSKVVILTQLFENSIIGDKSGCFAQLFVLVCNMMMM